MKGTHEEVHLVADDGRGCALRQSQRQRQCGEEGQGGRTTSLGGTSPVVLRADVVRSDTECIADRTRNFQRSWSRSLFEAGVGVARSRRGGNVRGEGASVLSRSEHEEEDEEEGKLAVGCAGT